MSSPLIIAVLAIIGFYLIAGLLRFIRQEWRGLAQTIRRITRGGND